MWEGEEQRLKTIRTLMRLAEGNSASSCWDDRRAEELLRNESTADELRSLGMSEAMIQHIFELHDE